ncbi:helix-turn-helix transcriptional regulator [Roseibacillus persicicus]|uniref:helix-turn-helix domain-containing protein n=1 Tax=Roseibacillus persicicus TaxID=454148 RepID=UPI00398AC211
MENPGSSLGAVGKLMEAILAEIRSRLRERNKEIGSRIRQARILKSKSLNSLSGNLGVSYQQLQKYEKGINRISASMLMEVSQVLDLPIGFFFEQSKESPNLLSPEHKTAIQIHALKDKTLKSVIMRMVEEFSSS